MPCSPNKLFFPHLRDRLDVPTFPWKFALLLDADEAVVARTARECQEEMGFPAQAGGTRG